MKNIRVIIIKIIILATYIFNAFIFRGKKVSRIIILTYHNILNSAQYSNSKIKYSVLENEFIKQMSYLKKNNYEIIDFNELLKYKRLKTTSNCLRVIITFDDGYMNTYRYAFNILKSFNYKATVFLTTDYIDKDIIYPFINESDIYKLMNENKYDFIPLTWGQVREMAKYNISFGSHTKTHRRLYELNDEELIDEIAHSKNIIEKEIGKKITLFSYPYEGPRNRIDLIRIKKYLELTGYECACSTKAGYVTTDSDNFNLERVDVEHSDSLFWFKAKLEGSINIIRAISNLKYRILSICKMKESQIIKY